MDKFILEDFFLNTEERASANKKLVLVIYDIVSNKRRNKFVKLMEHYGVRVQKSAFEMIITSKQYNDLISKIPSHITDEDNVRVYKLKITGEVVSWGSGLTEPEEVIII